MPGTNPTDPNIVSVKENDSSFSENFETTDNLHTEDVWFAETPPQTTTLEIDKSVTSFSNYRDSGAWNGFDTTSDDENGEGDNLFAFRDTVVEFKISITNTSDVTATGVVVQDTIPENIDIWQPGDSTSFSAQGVSWSNGTWSNNFDPSQLEIGDTSNGTVNITEPGLADGGIVHAGQTHGMAEGNVVWELGQPLEPGETVELTYYGMRGLGQYNYSTGTEFETTAEIIAVDQKLTSDSVKEDSEDVTWVSPIAFDLNDSGEIDTTGDATNQGHAYTGGETVDFDLDDDGENDNIEWLDGSGDGLLIDMNVVAAEDGNVDGSALFGDEGGEWSNGYEKLSDLKDANGDGVVSGEELDGLAVWVDDGDGVLEEGENRSLSDLGIEEISTSFTTNSQGQMISQTQANAEAVGSVTYSLAGSDASLFQIDEQTGEVSFADGFVPDYEAPQDADGDNTYEVEVIRSGDNLNEPESELLQIQITDDVNDNTDGGSTTDITYSLAGEDAGIFQVDAETGELSYQNWFTPDYDQVWDMDRDHTYEVSVIGSDADGNPVSQSDWELTVAEDNQATWQNVGEDISDSGASDTLGDETDTGENGDTGESDETPTGDETTSVSTYSLAGEDAEIFQVDAETGELSYQNWFTPDYDQVWDMDRDHTYEVSVIGSDADGNPVSQSDWELTVAEDNQATWQNVGEDISDSGASDTLGDEADTGENGDTGESDETPTGDETTSVSTYSLAGEDAGIFQVDAETGELSYQNWFTPDYDQVWDMDRDHTYEVSVIGSDADGNPVSQSDWELTVAEDNQATWQNVGEDISEKTLDDMSPEDIMAALFVQEDPVETPEDEEEDDMISDLVA
ncbi:hypothetical protein MACH17_09490 [Phaeobacter inhibens]|uniref:hypothetical protein n=1 Tax=Phaeobacter inhibens TaxID=221822 RepID=UPI00276E5777|nr:hypothetical protein [Phaeobacter inhibens]GLO69432.1 hypothetical protein MACH17_09490 [Phaeobacter inhibens]